jgi:hypothetical protein
MKFLTAVLTVLALAGFGGAAFAACDGHAGKTAAQQEKPPVLPPATQS